MYLYSEKWGLSNIYETMSVHGGKTVFVIVSMHRLPPHRADVRAEGTKRWWVRLQRACVRIRVGALAVVFVLLLTRHLRKKKKCSLHLRMSVMEQEKLLILLNLHKTILPLLHLNWNNWFLRTPCSDVLCSLINVLFFCLVLITI